MLVIKWYYDHTARCIVQGLCLVNVAVVVDNQLQFIIPWILRKQLKHNNQRRTIKKEQDAKTTAAIEMVRTIIDLFKVVGVPDKQLVIMTEAWYGNKIMQRVI